jgi:competence protein ComEC
MSEIRLKIIFFSLIIFFLGFYIFRLASVSSLKIPEEKEVVLRGYITEQPYLKNSKQVIKLKNIILISDRFPGFSYGDHIEVVGTFERRVINPFLITYYSSFPTIKKFEEGKKTPIGMVFKKSLFNLRGLFERRINEIFTEPEGSLLLGILLGIKRSLPENFYNSLQETGTLHIVVASGYNVIVISGFVIVIFNQFFKRKKAIFLSFIAVLFYCFLTGAEPPIMRASIMAFLSFLAIFFGRVKTGIIILAATAVLMLLASPLLLFDLGFQLSFLATFGILTIYPLLKEKKFFKVPFFGSELATTFAAQITVTPLILLKFGKISFLSPFVNALVLPLVPLIMNFGLVVLVFSSFSMPLASFFSLFLWPILKIFVLIVEFFSKASFLNLKLESLSVWWVVGYYFIVFYIIFKKRNKWQTKTKSF